MNVKHFFAISSTKVQSTTSSGQYQKAYKLLLVDTLKKYTKFVIQIKNDSIVQSFHPIWHHNNKSDFYWMDMKLVVKAALAGDQKAIARLYNAYSHKV